MDHQNNLSMLSYNVTGLKDKSKRAGIFNWLQSKNSDTLLLQETHCHLKNETKNGVVSGRGNVFGVKVLRAAKVCQFYLSLVLKVTL